MTKAIRVLITTVLFGTAVFATAQEAVRVQVPFEFHVSNHTLPAGTYTVRRVFERNVATLNISGANGLAPVAFLVSTDSLEQVGSGLSFRQYGDSYFLSGVTTPSGKFSLLPSREERVVASKRSSGEVSVGGSN